MIENIHAAAAPAPVGPYPHAKRVGPFLFLSGIGPRAAGTDLIPGVLLDQRGRKIGRDIEAQCRSAFDNVLTILRAAGATVNAIVDNTVFLTHLNEDFAAYNRVYAEYFAGSGKPNPTRTTVEVTALPTPIDIEIKVIAWLGE